MHYQKKMISVGDEIDSICTRCKEETIHRVVAMVEGRVHLVICTRCWGQHRYRPSPEAKPKRASSTKRQTKGRVHAKTGQSSRPKEPLEEWQNHRKNAEDIRPQSYDQSSSYRVGQSIEHLSYGPGFVRKVIGSTKMEVLFQWEVKVLVMNRPRSTHA